MDPARRPSNPTASTLRIPAAATAGPMVAQKSAQKNHNPATVKMNGLVNWGSELDSLGPAVAAAGIRMGLRAGIRRVFAREFGGASPGRRESIILQGIAY
ncbi:hypothetical protein Lbir_1984 [Legionella birminghamensis]|uniref:Uncharacterized protein n=1 Tax=Legionella birminghamensis TaxID=28083 RepID=A0A378I6F8_9GAMM|nr:hypothetical protein Lbir_1984 [Legionella birminghamensis]STX30325.1 Uncharacterised protein [Legionella birminghamensis]